MVHIYLESHDYVLLCFRNSWFTPDEYLFSNQVLSDCFLRDQAENVKKPRGINAIDQLLQVEVGFRRNPFFITAVEKVRVTESFVFC